MSAGIVAMGVGRTASSQALSSQALSYDVPSPDADTVATPGARIMLVVTCLVGNAYFKLAPKGATGITVSAADRTGVIVGGANADAYYMPIDRNVEPIFTGTVSAVEMMGTVS